MADFKITATSELITIDGLTIAPAEADHLKSAVSFAGGMRDFPGLPPKIDYEQFHVHFHEDGTLVVTRAVGQGGDIRFNFDRVDELVLVINQALGISIDKKKLSPSPRCVGDPGFHASGDIIEGSY
jgi:hypothetical protein